MGLSGGAGAEARWCVQRGLPDDGVGAAKLVEQLKLECITIIALVGNKRWSRGLALLALLRPAF